MGKNSKIAWTDHTFNPWWGCTKVSEGCKYCYADTFSHRMGLDIWGKDKPRRFFGDKHWNEPVKWNKEAQGRTLVFCASMGDIFEDREDLIEPRERLFKLIYETQNLTWLLLTKRPENIAYQVSFIPLNVWLGVTVENQKNFWRVPELLELDASVHFVSLEPMLESINLNFPDRPNPYRDTWVIVGGESGPKCRPFEWGWARDIRDQCQKTGVPFFMKQGGGYPNKQDQLEDFPEDLRIREYPD